MSSSNGGRRLPDLPEGKLIEVPGRGTLFVRDAPGPRPDSPVVLLLHGWTVTADLNWFRCFEPLGRHYRVVTFDHRGHGRGIRSRRRITMRLLADDAAAVTEALGIDRFSVVGYSMGGAVGQLLARRHRQRLDGLVVAATSPTFKGPGSGLLTPGMMNLIAAGSRAVPRSTVRSVFERMVERRTAGMDPWAVEEVRSCHPRSVLEAGASLFLFDSQEWFGSLDLPIASVITARDNRVSPERQGRFAELARHTSVHEAACGHDGCVSEPDVFVPRLLDALESVTQSTRV